MKKNVALAELVACAMYPPRLWKLKSTAINNILSPQKKDPIIIGFRRPYLSRKNDGKRDPMTNMRLMTPPRRRERFRVSPTLFCRTEVT